MAWNREDEACLQRAVRQGRAYGRRVRSRSVRSLLLCRVPRVRSPGTRQSLTHIGQGIDLLGPAGPDSTIRRTRWLRAAGAIPPAPDGFARHSTTRRALGALGDSLRAIRELRAWRAMEAEPYMYKGLWEDVVRVAEEGLPRCWEIREWSPCLLDLGVGRHRLREARPPRAGPDGSWIAPCRNVKLRDASGCGRWCGSRWRWPQLFRRPRGWAGGADCGAPCGRRSPSGATTAWSKAPRCACSAQACEAVGDRGAADAAFRQSVEVLEAIQSRPELGQTLLAYGRFRSRDDERRRPSADRARSRAVRGDGRDGLDRGGARRPRALAVRRRRRRGADCPRAGRGSRGRPAPSAAAAAPR